MEVSSLSLDAPTQRHDVAKVRSLVSEESATTDDSSNAGLSAYEIDQVEVISIYPIDEDDSVVEGDVVVSSNGEQVENTNVAKEKKLPVKVNTSTTKAKTKDDKKPYKLKKKLSSFRLFGKKVKKSRKSDASISASTVDSSDVSTAQQKPTKTRRVATITEPVERTASEEAPMEEEEVFLDGVEIDSEENNIVQGTMAEEGRVLKEVTSVVESFEAPAEEEVLLDRAEIDNEEAKIAQGTKVEEGQVLNEATSVDESLEVEESPVDKEIETEEVPSDEDIVNDAEEVSLLTEVEADKYAVPDEATAVETSPAEAQGDESTTEAVLEQVTPAECEPFEGVEATEETSAPKEETSATADEPVHEGEDDSLLSWAVPASDIRGAEIFRPSFTEYINEKAKSLESTEAVKGEVNSVDGEEAKAAVVWERVVSDEEGGPSKAIAPIVDEGKTQGKADQSEGVSLKRKALTVTSRSRSRLARLLKSKSQKAKIETSVNDVKETPNHEPLADGPVNEGPTETDLVTPSDDDKQPAEVNSAEEAPNDEQPGDGPVNEGPTETGLVAPSDDDKQPAEVNNVKEAPNDELSGDGPVNEGPTETGLVTPSDGDKQPAEATNVKEIPTDEQPRDGTIKEVPADTDKEKPSDETSSDDKVFSASLFDAEDDASMIEAWLPRDSVQGSEGSGCRPMRFVECHSMERSRGCNVPNAAETTLSALIDEFLDSTACGRKLDQLNCGGVKMDQNINDDTGSILPLDEGDTFRERMMYDDDTLPTYDDGTYDGDTIRDGDTLETMEDTVDDITKAVFILKRHATRLGVSESELMKRISEKQDKRDEESKTDPVTRNFDAEDVSE